jgi:hypothetical protein
LRRQDLNLHLTAKKAKDIQQHQGGDEDATLVRSPHGWFSWTGMFAVLTGAAWTNAFTQMNLVSDIQVLASFHDSASANPWGVSFSTTSPFWISDQGTNEATLYSVTSSGVVKLPQTVAIPVTACGPQGPTGQVSNNTSSFVLNGSPAYFTFRI